MKRITATEARKDWFRLLDEVAAGEVAIIERNGRRLRLVREEEGADSRALPDYRSLIRAESVDAADRWSWKWPGDGIDGLDGADGEDLLPSTSEAVR